MFRNHVASNIAGFGGFVNLAATLVAVALIGIGYSSAIGQFAGIA